jgi:hypothetical protein
MAAHEGGHLTFLVTQAGEPFTATSFYNWFVECAEKAGLGKGLSPPGLSNAAAHRLAEAGCTPHGRATQEPNVNIERKPMAAGFHSREKCSDKS